MQLNVKQKQQIFCLFHQSYDESPITRRLHSPTNAIPEREHFLSIGRYIHSAKHPPGCDFCSTDSAKWKIYWPGENGGRELEEVLSAN